MSQTIVDRLLEIGFLTGSRAFGTNDDDSDVDIAFFIGYSKEVDKVIKGFEKCKSLYFNGFYIEVEDLTINLIPLSACDYESWRLATQAMVATVENWKHIRSKQKYALFMGIVSLFKAVL